MKATVRERLEDFVTTFENPEISAMAAICRILEDLPDEPARLRVMRWAFGKFNDEFKRPLAAVPVTPVVAMAPRAAPVATQQTPPTLVPVPVEPEDFDRQVAELGDLFGDRPDGIRLAAPRSR